MRRDTLGLILAGGRASRIGGGDKGLLEVGGRPMLARVIDTLRPQVGGLLLNANGDPGRFERFGLTIVPDQLPDRPGPIAGVLAGLDWAAEHAPDLAWLVTAPADAPFLPRDLVVRLHAARGSARSAMAASAGRTHPVAALLPIGARQAMGDAFASGVRKAGALFTDAALAEWDTDPVDPFFNVNTEDALAEANRLVARAR